MGVWYPFSTKWGRPHIYCVQEQSILFIVKIQPPGLWAAKSYPFEDKWTSKQLSVLQLMGITLADDIFGVLNMGDFADAHWAIVVNDSPTDSIVDAKAGATEVREIVALMSKDVSAAVAELLCLDSVEKSQQIQVGLANLLGVSHRVNCSHVLPLCSDGL